MLAHRVLMASGGVILLSVSLTFSSNDPSAYAWVKINGVSVSVGSHFVSVGDQITAAVYSSDSYDWLDISLGSNLGSFSHLSSGGPATLSSPIMTVTAGMTNIWATASVEGE
jgi:hypothetical protein